MLTVPELGDAEWPDDHWPILQACREELLDHQWLGYEHGIRATKVLGCKGPMCMKAARDYGRELQRRINGVQYERVSSVRQFDAFLDGFIAYSRTYHHALGMEPPPRRKLVTVRTYRRKHLIPLSTAQKLHRSRRRLEEVSGETS